MIASHNNESVYLHTLETMAMKMLHTPQNLFFVKWIYFLVMGHPENLSTVLDFTKIPNYFQ